MNFHQTAIISPKSKIGFNVTIGPYSIIHDNVVIGDNVVVEAYCELGVPTNLSNGSVLKIGGVKEKSQGAQQFGIKTLVVPIGNKFDFLELPSNLKDSFERVFFVENCKQVYKIGFNLDTTGIDCYIPKKYLGNVNEYIEEEEQNTFDGESEDEF